MAQQITLLLVGKLLDKLEQRFVWNIKLHAHQNVSHSTPPTLSPSPIIPPPSGERRRRALARAAHTRYTSRPARDRDASPDKAQNGAQRAHLDREAGDAGRDADL